jgi:hypothetical protein
LVPAAFEKQGSAKLEKAEILQMTVDHLKLLSSKGTSILAALSSLAHSKLLVYLDDMLRIALFVKIS